MNYIKKINPPLQKQIFTSTVTRSYRQRVFSKSLRWFVDFSLIVMLSYFTLALFVNIQYVLEFSSIFIETSTSVSSKEVENQFVLTIYLYNTGIFAMSFVLYDIHFVPNPESPSKDRASEAMLDSDPCKASFAISSMSELKKLFPRRCAFG